MTKTTLQQIQEILQRDESQDLRTSIYSAFLQDEQLGANMIVDFAAEHGVCLSAADVVAHLNDMDDEEIDVELTPEMLSAVAGGDKCCG